MVPSEFDENFMKGRRLGYSKVSGEAKPTCVLSYSPYMKRTQFHWLGLSMSTFMHFWITLEKTVWKAEENGWFCPFLYCAYIYHQILFCSLLLFFSVTCIQSSSVGQFHQYLSPQYSCSSFSIILFVLEMKNIFQFVSSPLPFA